MANLNKINKDYQGILLDLKPKEIESYITAVNKKIIETYPTATSDYFNVERFNKLSDNLEETTDFLKTKYPSIIGFEYGSKYAELNKKYLFETEKAFYLLWKYELTNLFNLIQDNIINIDYFLTSIYLYYNYWLHMKETLVIKEIGVPEEEIDSLTDYIYNFENRTSFQGLRALNMVNTFIEINLEQLEVYIGKFKEYPKIIYDKDTSEEVKSIIDNINKIHEEGHEYINKLEELKANPFKNGIEIVIESENKVDTELGFNKHQNKLLEKRIAEAPSYNFTTFEIVLPDYKKILGVNTDG